MDPHLRGVAAKRSFHARPHIERQECATPASGGCPSTFAALAAGDLHCIDPASAEDISSFVLTSACLPGACACSLSAPSNSAAARVCLPGCCASPLGWAPGRAPGSYCRSNPSPLSTLEAVTQRVKGDRALLFSASAPRTFLPGVSALGRRARAHGLCGAQPRCQRACPSAHPQLRQGRTNRIRWRVLFIVAGAVVIGMLLRTPSEDPRRRGPCTERIERTEYIERMCARDGW